MSRSDHARQPRTTHQRLLVRALRFGHSRPRPELDRRSAIAEQVAALVDELDEHMPANSTDATPEPAAWARMILDQNPVRAKRADRGEVSEVAYGVDPEVPWPPVMTFGEAVAEMGNAFVLTGPKLPPATVSKHYVRVYELARVCNLPSKNVIGFLRLRGEWVTSHLSLIARPAARDFLTTLDIHDDLDDLIEHTRPLSVQDRFAQAFA